MIIQKLDRIARKAREYSHKRQCRALLRTPAIAPKHDGVILFSMIGTAVVLPYLLAIKSLHHQLQRGRIVLLDDGTLTVADKAVLAEQLGNPDIIPIASVDTGVCPKGGTWERLLTIQRLRADNYVIQLDSDTVTLGPVDEVAAALAANRSFTLSGGEKEAPLGFLPLPDFLKTFYPSGPTDAIFKAFLKAVSCVFPAPRRAVTRGAVQALQVFPRGQTALKRWLNFRKAHRRFAARGGQNGELSRSHPII
jgi:hypothetical protein